jgi:hypothetical protein
MRKILPVLLLAGAAVIARADVTAVASQADTLHDRGSFDEARTLVLGAAATASSAKDQAELYWRAARETLELGDLAEKAKKPSSDLLAIFSQGEAYADKAIAADPANDLGYYWKSSNIGRWGQTKGILNSLFKAGPMKDLLVKEISLNPDRTDAYYVLGQLYRELPGWPASFGNVDAAVSFGRRAVDLRLDQFSSGAAKELVYNFMNELAKSLWKRNWTSEKRVQAQAEKAAKAAAAVGALDKAMYYEGTVALEAVSDRDEARALVQAVVADLGKKSGLTAGEQKDLDKARTILAGWG